MPQLQMTDKWTVFRKWRKIDTIYSDFEKTFDKVPHMTNFQIVYMWNARHYDKLVLKFLAAGKYR